MTKISVIIPVYNVEDYLEKCLDSIINQTLKDIEIICVNDESTDESLDILEKYSKLDERIIVISQKNNGAGSCRNKGIDIAKGEYISFVDSDDWLELNALEELYENAINNSSDIVLFNSIEHKPNNNFRERIYLPKNKCIDYNNFTFNHKLYKNFVLNKSFVIWDKLYKTSFLKENNLKFEYYRVFEDVKFHIECMILANKISYLPKILYNYNKKNASSTISSTVFTKSLIIFDVFDGVEQFLKENNYFEEFKTNYLKFKIIESKNNLNRTTLDCKEQFFKRMKKEFLKMDVSIENLEKLPQDLASFYIIVLNSYSYDNFEKFIKSKNKGMNFINKIKLNKEIKNFDELGTNQDDRKESFIISLTSFPERMYDIHYCLYSLLNQEFKPDKLVLWLAEEEFPNKEEDIPKEVLNLKKNGLTIKWCNNIKSYKKLIPALKEYPNDVIITADDDIYYPKNWLKDLYEEHLEYPNCIIGKRCRRINLNNGLYESYDQWKLLNNKTEPSYLNFSTNGGGSLFPPNALNKFILEEELFKKLCPSADDIWIWSMAILNKTKIKGSKKPMKNLKYINIAREIGLLNHKTLWETNKNGANDIQFNNIITHYPEILKIINEEIEEN